MLLKISSVMELNQKGTHKYMPAVGEDINEYEYKLSMVGTPDNVLEDISNTHMAFIAENLEENATFESIENFEINAEQTDNGISTYAVSELPTSLMEITVVCYSVKVNGEQQYEFFHHSNGNQLDTV